MVNGSKKRRMNKKNRFNINRCPGTSSTDIIAHLKPDLRKAPDEIIIHAGTNHIANNINYLSNVKRIVKSKDTKLCFNHRWKDSQN